jgi:hypothetical protein
MFKYLHRMPGKLVKDDSVFRLVKGTGDVLNEQTESLLFLLGCHLGPRGRQRRRRRRLRDAGSRKPRRGLELLSLRLFRSKSDNHDSKSEWLIIFTRGHHTAYSSNDIYYIFHLGTEQTKNTKRVGSVCLSSNSLTMPVKMHPTKKSSHLQDASSVP